MIIQELVYKVSLQVDEFLNGKRKVVNETDDLDKKTKGPLARLKKGFGEAADSAAELGKESENAFAKVHSGLAKYLGVAVTLEAFRRGFLSTTKALVDLGNTSSFLDMSAKSLEGFNRAAAATGSSEQSMTSMLMRIKNAQNWQQTGWGAPDSSTIAMMQLEGMTGENILRAKDPGESLLAQARALRQLDKPMAAQAWQMMGGQSDMFGLMYEGNLGTLQKEFEKGSNATNAAIKQARDVNKVLQELDQTVKGLGNDMVLAFGPTVNEGLKQFSDWITNNKDNILDFFKEGAEWAKKFSDAVGGPTNAAILLLGMKGGKTTAMAAMAIIAGKTLNDPEKVREWGDKAQGVADTANGWLGLDSPMAPLEKIRNIDINDEEQRAILMDALAMQESSGNRYAVSKAGAKGLYQLMPDAAREMGLTVNDQIDERLDPEKSREAAEGYLMKQFNRFGNLEDALRAYHDGPGNVAEWIAGGRKSMTGRTLSKYGASYPLDVGEHLGEQLKLTERSMPSGMAGNTDNSQTHSTHINTVNVNSNPQSVNLLQKDIEEQARRGKMTIAYSSGNQ